MQGQNDGLLSLNKVISGTGFCSRREADKYIETGRVTINNKTAKKGAWVKPGDVVAVDGEKISSAKKSGPIYIAFNKPVGITSTTDLKDKSNIIDYINHQKRIFPVGRLDKDSDGLIILTNDGDIVNKILRASNQHEKEYIVTVDKPVDEAFVRRMSEGVPVLDEITKKCFVRAEGSRRFRITLTQGLNRQIRRMCEYLGYKVHTLTRVRIMNIKLETLPVGKWRYFTPAEIEKMNELIAGSSKVDKGITKKREKPEIENRKLKTVEEPSIPEPDENEPTRPFYEYEEVKRKKKTGNQWWADNKKKRVTKGKTPSSETKKSTRRSNAGTNKAGNKNSANHDVAAGFKSQGANNSNRKTKSPKKGPVTRGRR